PTRRSSALRPRAAWSRPPAPSAATRRPAPNAIPNCRATDRPRAPCSPRPHNSPGDKESPAFTHNKRLQYTVRVNEPNPALANLLLAPSGGPQGQLAAANRYFTQGLAEDDPGRKDMLIDIATEELSHLGVIGSLVGMLNKGAKGRLAEGVEEE